MCYSLKSEFFLSTRQFINRAGIVSQNKRSINAVDPAVAVNVVQLKICHDFVAENRHTVYSSAHCVSICTKNDRSVRSVYKTVMVNIADLICRLSASANALTGAAERSTPAARMDMSFFIVSTSLFEILRSSPVFHQRDGSCFYIVMAQNNEFLDISAGYRINAQIISYISVRYNENKSERYSAAT